MIAHTTECQKNPYSIITAKINSDITINAWNI